MNLSIKYTDPESIVSIAESVMNSVKKSTKLEVPEKGEIAEELFEKTKYIVSDALRRLMKHSDEFHITFDLSEFIGDVCDFVALNMRNNDADSRSDSENRTEE